MQKIKRGDTVKVCRGKSRGKVGKVLDFSKDGQYVIVEKTNMITKHVKKRNGQPGEKLTKEGKIHVSNVMLVTSDGKKVSRVKVSVEGKARVRTLKKTGEQVAASAPKATKKSTK